MSDDSTPEAETKPESDRGWSGRKLIIVLAVIAAAALLAVAGLVGYIIADRNGGDSPAAKSSSVDASGRDIPDLRPVAEAALEDGADAERDGSAEAFRAWVDEYAAPECARMLIGLAEMFGSESEPEPTTPGYPRLVSVEQDGWSGTVVTKSEPSSDPETTRWIYDKGEWRFTCSDIFGGTDESDSAEFTPEPTTPPSSATTVAPSPTDNVDPEVETLPQSEAIAGEPCYEWEYRQIRFNLQCMNSPTAGYIWLPGAT